MKKFGVVLILFQILLVGCAIDDDPTDEWVGTWTLKMWDGDNQKEESLKIFKDALFRSAIQSGFTKELVNAFIAVDEIETTEEFTFDNNSRWEFRIQAKVSATKEMKELKNDPDKEVREFAAGFMEAIERENESMVRTATGSYIVTEDGFTMTGDRRNRMFVGRMSGIWKRNGSKLTLIGDRASGLGTIVLSK